MEGIMSPQELFAFKIPEFCTAYRISRSLYYSLRSEGRGPRTMTLGRSQRISHEAAEEWRRRMEAEANTPEAAPADSEAA